MQILKLRKEFLNMVISGEKTATSRFGVRNITPGPLRLIATEDESFTVDVVVTGVEYLAFDLITEQDAKNEGYACLKDLTNTLRKIYPETTPNSVYTIISFIKEANYER